MTNEEIKQQIYLKLREEAKTSLFKFMKFLRPEYSKPRHLQPIVDEMERVLKGETRKFMFSVPPQHYKSETSLFFCALMLTLYPKMRIIYASYAKDIAVGQTRKAIRYYKEFNPNVKLTKNTEDEMETEFGGGIFTTSNGGVMTGKPADIILIDDPIKNRKEAESPTYRRVMKDWFDDAVKSRIRPHTSLLVIQTRWVIDDLIGYISKTMEDVPYINLPAINQNGEPLLYSLSFYESIKKSNIYSFSSLYQGEPIPRGHGLFREVQYTSELPKNYRISIGADLAYTAKTTADYSVIVVMYQCLDTKKYYIAEAIHWQGNINYGISQILLIHKKYPNTQIHLEANGIQKAIFEMIRTAIYNETNKQNVLVTAELKGDKFVRAQTLSQEWNSGNVYVLDSINDLYIEMMLNFTGVNDLNDDYIDGSVFAFRPLLIPQHTPRKFY